MKLSDISEINRIYEAAETDLEVLYELGALRGSAAGSERAEVDSYIRDLAHKDQDKARKKALIELIGLDFYILSLNEDINRLIPEDVVVLKELNALNKVTHDTFKHAVRKGDAKLVKAILENDEEISVDDSIIYDAIDSQDLNTLALLLQLYNDKNVSLKKVANHISLYPAFPRDGLEPFAYALTKAKNITMADLLLNEMNSKGKGPVNKKLQLEYTYDERLGIDEDGKYDCQTKAPKKSETKVDAIGLAILNSKDESALKYIRSKGLNTAFLENIFKYALRKNDVAALSKCIAIFKEEGEDLSPEEYIANVAIHHTVEIFKLILDELDTSEDLDIIIKNILTSGFLLEAEACEKLRLILVKSMKNRHFLTEEKRLEYLNLAIQNSLFEACQLFSQGKLSSEQQQMIAELDLSQKHGLVKKYVLFDWLVDKLRRADANEKDFNQLLNIVLKAALDKKIHMEDAKNKINILLSAGNGFKCSGDKDSLMMAIKLNSAAICKRLSLAQGETTYDEAVSLSVTASLEIFKEIVSKVKDINRLETIDSSVMSLVLKAIDDKALTLEEAMPKISLLLELGAWPGNLEWDQYSPMICAWRLESNELLELLVKHGARYIDIKHNSKAGPYQTPFEAMKLIERVIKTGRYIDLLQVNINPKIEAYLALRSLGGAPNKFKRVVIDIVDREIYVDVVRQNMFQVSLEDLKIMDEKAISLDIRKMNKITKSMEALQQKFGTDKPVSGYTSLFCTMIRRGDVELTQYLFEKLNVNIPFLQRYGADLCVYNAEGLDPAILHELEASFNTPKQDHRIWKDFRLINTTSLPMVSFLIDKGMDVTYSRTLDDILRKMLLAANIINFEVVDLFIEKGIDVNKRLLEIPARNRKIKELARDILSLALAAEREDVVRYLLGKGAVISPRTANFLKEYFADAPDKVQEIRQKYSIDLG